jgi:hypothetical protein
MGILCKNPGDLLDFLHVTLVNMYFVGMLLATQGVDGRLGDEL